MTIRDADSTSLSSATIRITGNFRADEDALAVSLTEGGPIRAAYDSFTGVLTLSGEASLADYAKALVSLTYANGSDAPSEAPRTVSITVVDTDGLTSVPVIREVAVVARPDAPEARDDNAFVEAGNAVTISVLANDADPDGGALTLGAVGEPGHGAAVLNPDGTITYTPKAGFTGPDSFTYTIRDADGLTAQATVDVIVGRAGHQAIDGDVFLQGAYMEIGVAQHGSLGSKSDAPEGFHPQAGGGRQLSFVIDDDGWDTGADTTSNDVTIPGTPEDAIVIAHDGQSFANSERTNNIQFEATTTDTSSGGRLQATTIGTTADGLKLTQVIDLDPNATYFRTTVTLTNTSATTMADAASCAASIPIRTRSVTAISPPTTTSCRTQRTRAASRSSRPMARIPACRSISSPSTRRAGVERWLLQPRRLSPERLRHAAGPERRPRRRRHLAHHQVRRLGPGQAATHSFYTSLNGRQGANDLVVGSARAETLDGRGGDDIILGLGGGDTLTGGTGRDTFVFDAPTFGKTSITDFTAGADLLEFDRAVFGSAEAVLGRAAQSGGDVTIAYDRDHVLTLKNMLLADLHASDIHIL